MHTTENHEQAGFAAETEFPIETKFFLGANTPDGFIGFADELYDYADDWRVFLIKSGPGTGKSTLMRRVAEAMTERGLDVELLYCSSDPKSLDGVRVPAIRACILDATAPHVVEPRYWGAVESIISLGDAIDSNYLAAHAEAFIRATERCSEAHVRTRRLLSGAAALLGDNQRMAATHVNIKKVLRTADGIARREFAGGSGQRGCEHRRFLSAVTPQGEVVFHETLQALCPHIYLLDDEYGAASAQLLVQLKERALDAGWDVIVCPCPLNPKDKLEHLIVPEVGVAFTTSNSRHKADFPVYRRIHATRFTSPELARKHKQLLLFNRKAAGELLREAVESAKNALCIHDDIETYSRAAMNVNQLQAITDTVIARFIGLAEQRMKPAAEADTP